MQPNTQALEKKNMENSLFYAIIQLSRTNKTLEIFIFNTKMA